MTKLFMRQINVEVNMAGGLVKTNDRQFVVEGEIIEVTRVGEDGTDDTVFEAVETDSNGWYKQGFLEGGIVTMNGVEKQTYYAGDTNNVDLGLMTFVLVEAKAITVGQLVYDNGVYKKTDKPNIQAYVLNDTEIILADGRMLEYANKWEDDDGILYDFYFDIDATINVYGTIK